MKVLEDRKVFLDSSYYSAEDPNMPSYIKEVFDRGLPADFRLIGATTRSPEEIIPAIRSRCVEIFFRPLQIKEIREIAENTIKKINLNVSDAGLEMISRHCSNGREVVNLVQLCSGIAINEERSNITVEDIKWVIENGEYTEIIDKKLKDELRVGIVNGLAVHSGNLGIVIEVEATAKKNKSGKGTLKISGIIEEEELTSNNRKVKRKSTAYSSIENVLTALNNVYDISGDEFDIHVNIPGGIPVDGPSAGITIATAIYSAIKVMPVNSKIAMTGEISLSGLIKPIGGINAKITAAKKAGANKIIIPIDNWHESFEKDDGVEIIPVSKIEEVIEVVFGKNLPVEKIDILSAKSSKYQ